jgi:hypothetical protein
MTEDVLNEQLNALDLCPENPDILWDFFWKMQYGNFSGLYHMLHKTIFFKITTRLKNFVCFSYKYGTLSYHPLLNKKTHFF